MTTRLPFPPRSRRLSAVAAVAAVAAIALGASTASGAELSDYKTAVLPIMKSHCWECHSNDHEVKGSLALDDLAEVRDYQVGEHNLIRPGNPERSDFLQRLKLDPAEHDFMPRNGKALRSRDLAVIEQWIAEGAIVDRENPSEKEAARMQGAAERVAFLPWTNRAERTIEARFQKLEGDSLELLLRDGRRAVIELDTLDDASQAQAKRIAANQ
jgi:mono/diheme cytochrome c family protein